MVPSFRSPPQLRQEETTVWGGLVTLLGVLSSPGPGEVHTCS